MNWTAPDVVYVLEQRLRTARLELMDDPRIRNAHEARSRESVNFVVQLIEDKLAAAAKCGLDAAEASLRLAAAAALLENGAPVELVRQRLEELGRPLLRPPRPESAAIRRVGWSAGTVAVAFVLVWTAAVSGAWLLWRFAGIWCAAGVGAGIVLSMPLHAWRKRRFAALLRRVVSDLPSRTVRYYIELLRKCVTDYERAVETIAWEKSGRGTVNPGMPGGRR